MSTERDTTRIVRSWLRTDEHESADRVLDDVLALLDATPQRRSWWPAWRIANMNNVAKLAIGVAAVAVVAVVGINLLPRSESGVGGAPSALPSALPSPSPSPTAQELPIGEVTPGRYVLTQAGKSLTLAMPAGWTHRSDGLIEKESLEIAWSPSRGFTESTRVYPDACKAADDDLQSVGPTVGDLVDALDKQLGTDAVVSDVTIGGRAGKRVEIAQAAGVDRAACSEGAEGALLVWRSAGDAGWYTLPPGIRGVLEIVDVDGVRLVFLAAIGSDTPASEVAEVEAILDSIQFE